MKKINQEEYEILKGLENRWKWIARDNNNALWIYAPKPRKNTSSTWQISGKGATRVDTNLFQFIQWEDSEPYNINELIEEYEIENGMRYDFGKIKVVDIDTRKLATHNGYIYVKESEETEVKDLNWLKKEVHKKLESWCGVEGGIDGDGINEIMLLINQLDEPEVLSDKWIDENKKDSGVHYIGYYVPIGRLHDLLVPKQELPVVPTWFDEWWKDITKGGGSLFHNIERFYDELFSSGTIETYGYISSPDNKKKLLNIIINELEYEVEEEQKYIIQIAERDFMVMDDDGVMYPVDINIHNYKYQFTEQEIKDYDERYWAFRKPVEELEE